ncbi:MAG: carboxylating nicotinate-nucleotide diphosphorylase [Lactobacillaceae bacterium]|jgi:nicotinate-nucleotide pyrophosphorylase (carboxylating)|nr:carboxylating nicotinate-nucleotide diphosphorylase [Lactobacillaceae bacterium]
MNQLLVKNALQTFINEDVGTGDISAELIFPTDKISSGHFLLKSAGVVCGLPLAQYVYDLLGGNVQFEALVVEGSYHAAGTVIGKVTGSARTILTGERLILNLWQRMSGIATMTRNAVDRLADPNIRICDTRKTAPGLRMFDKYSVRQGGGVNHRFGLYDGVMLKDNHIAFAGGITEAVNQVREQTGQMVNIEVEVETIDQLKEAIAAHANVIMFDNRSAAEAKQFQALVPDDIATEISGGITLATIAEYRGTGVDYISLGFLTNAVQNLDISFLSDNVQKGN